MEKINYKELRVGNNIYGASNDSLITITPEKINILRDNPNLGIPIELSDKILISMGFVRLTKGEKNSCFELEGIKLFNLGQGYFFANSLLPGKSIKVKHVHRLQNLIFEHTDKEISISK